MQTLTISQKNAIAAYNKASKSEKELLNNLFGVQVFNQKITDRIKTFDDVLEELDISWEDWEKGLPGLSGDEIAYRQIKMLVKVLNEGWVPDWDDSNQYKYYVWFEWKGSGVGFSCGVYVCDYSCSYVGSRLVFKSSELAIYAAKQFADLYNSFFIL